MMHLANKEQKPYERPNCATFLEKSLEIDMLMTENIVKLEIIVISLVNTKMLHIADVI